MSLLCPDPNAVHFLRIFTDFLLNNKTLFSKPVLFYHGESVYRTFLDNVNALLIPTMFHSVSLHSLPRTFLVPSFQIFFRLPGFQSFRVFSHMICDSVAF